ncbi:MAG: M2 family metallopeptidase [Thermoplasmata archaeon]|nr:M2 family metallopeptidase [Thermoplasmata archaeon]MCI4360009.1 M2 family metallopeptidase [Thermoplasmata archaeon]
MANSGAAESQAIVVEAETRLLDLSIEAQRAAWVYETFINEDTERLTSKADARVTLATVDLAKRAARVDLGGVPAETQRKLKLLRLSLPLLSPSDPAESEELARLVASMRGRYGKGRYRPQGAAEDWDLAALSRRMAESRNATELEELWTGWHAVGRPMRPEFSRYVELANRGAREVGFADTGAMWRSKYDMPPDEFAQEAERLWTQVRPLYRTLHAFVRKRLSTVYGPTLVPPAGPIPAHLLGNMWSQTWEHIYPVLAPSESGAGYDLTQILKERGVDERELVRIAERFFLSVGFERLPATFWDRSMFVKPAGREVLCHASAWDIDFVDDLRIKMCIDVTEEEFYVVHHELGHNFYQRAYRDQPFLFRDSANDGFHEAVGDTISLSITPEYLTRIGLLPGAPDPSQDTGLLLKKALEKVAFLPFGLLVDRWRWQVFSGELGPADYNSSWWEMRRRYQGIAPPVGRSEQDFDPGAKAHVPSNTPYMRYFLASILQFQFHRALAESSGWDGPLHRFSIYGNREAGAKLKRMFELGASRPWPDALEMLTGSRTMDASAILDYFRPLNEWLTQATEGAPMGWPGE